MRIKAGTILGFAARVLALLAAIAALQFLVPSGPTHAQVPLLSQTTTNAPTGSPLDALMEQARKDGSTVIVIGPPADAATPAEMPMTMTFTSGNLLQARENLKRMAANAAYFADNLPDALRAASPDGSASWLLYAIATAAGGLVIGQVLFFMTATWGRRHFSHLIGPANGRRSTKLAFLLSRAGLFLLSSAIMFAAAILVAVIFDSGHEPSRETIYVIISSYVIYRSLRSVIFWNVFAPGASEYRLINVSEESARRLFRAWVVVLAIGAVILGVCRWVQVFGLGNSDPAMMQISVDAHSLIFIVGMFFCAAMLALMAYVHRRELHAILLGAGDPARKPVWQRVVAFAALPLVFLYMALAWVSTSVRLALGQPGGYVLVAAPILIFVVAIFAYAIAAYLLELFYERREAAHRRRQIAQIQADRRAWRRAQAAEELMSEMSEDVRDMLDDGAEMAVMKVRSEPSAAMRPYYPAFKEFFQNVILATILVVCVGELGRLWGLDLGRPGGHPFARTLDILLVLIIAASAYRSVNRFIDHKIVEEGGTLDDQPFNPGEGDNEGGKSQSRLATLLPIFRNVLVAGLGAIGFMVVLANLGVDVGPLFAGAGVVGIAIGFGAQTLIRDIFSGAFFLIDDAFRKGEYIEIDKVKGVVEKISIRSFQLRHHLGAVHTVPFGEIKQLTNYSRDWVMMKLPLRLTYDTDIEKVRKLIKKLGQQLLDDPVVGPLFLQPLKSQGVYAMEDSAMIVRVKFMTRPGDQFVTRKVVYAAIRELFQKEDVHFAHREVTVRLADGQKADSLTPEQKEAIAGSVRSVIEDERPGAADAGKAAAAAL